MNCHELAAYLDGTLLRQRDPQWLEEARHHAEQCPSCSQLMQLHWLEEHLTELSDTEPSEVFVQAVMSRITRPEPAVIVSSQRFGWEKLSYPMIFVGALTLVAAYVFPAAGDPWLSNLWSSGGLIRTVGMSAYLAHHPMWAVLLSEVAALLIVVGLFLPEIEKSTIAHETESLV